MRDLSKILVLLPFDETDRSLLEASSPDSEYIYRTAGQLTPELLNDITVVIGNLPLFLLEHCKKLQWMQLGSAGSDQYTSHASQMLITNASGAYGLAISEHMLGVTLELFKNLHRYRDNQSHSLWQDESDAKTIMGCTALVIGLGDIGSEYAKRIKLLGGTVYGVRRKNLKKPAYVDGILLPDQIDSYLPYADIVALSLPNNSETYHIIDERRLSMMNPDSVLINVGRGSAVDTKALCRALKENWIAGAALDVTDPEPLPIENPLWGLKNAIITPHVSGGYHAPVTLHRIAAICAQNLSLYAAGRPLLNQVDPATGYRRSCKKTISLSDTAFPTK